MTIFLAALHLNDIGVIFILFVAFAPLILSLMALIDISKSQFKQGSNKLLWIAIVLLAPYIGSLIYFTVGKNSKLDRKLRLTAIRKAWIEQV